MTEAFDAESDTQLDDAEATGTSAKNSAKKRGNSEHLKPWKKGISGNPAGRPKKFFDFQAMCQEASPKAFRKLVELIDSDDERVSFMASKEICDRAWGKPKIIEDDTKDGKVTINIVKLAVGEEPKAKQIAGQVITLNRFSDGDAL